LIPLGKLPKDSRYFDMDEFKDLYVAYLNNNEDEDNQISELEFFKLAFKGAMEKMDELK